MNDLISRNKLKEDLIKFFPTDCLDGIESKTLFNQILHDIDNAPTVEYPFYAEAYQTGYEEGKNERTTGKWLIECGTTLHYVCSECGCAGDVWDKFCKHCGAKMKGGAE